MTMMMMIYIIIIIIIIIILLITSSVHLRKIFCISSLCSTDKTMVSIFFYLQLALRAPNTISSYSIYQAAVFFLFFMLFLLPSYNGVMKKIICSQNMTSTFLRRILFWSVICSPVRWRTCSLITKLFSASPNIWKSYYFASRDCEEELVSCYQNFDRKSLGKWPLGRCNIDGRRILESTLKKRVWKRGIEGIRLRIRIAGIPFERGIESPAAALQTQVSQD